jgi:hypothetical protein
MPVGKNLFLDNLSRLGITAWVHVVGRPLLALSGNRTWIEGVNLDFSEIGNADFASLL